MADPSGNHAAPSSISSPPKQGSQAKLACSRMESPPHKSPSLPPLSVQRVFSPLSPNLVIRPYRPSRLFFPCTKLLISCFPFLILREPYVTSVSPKQAEEKENEEPAENGSVDATKASSSPVYKCNSSAGSQYAGNSWERYFKSTVEECASKEIVVKEERRLEGLGDKYGAIALLDDDHEEEKWNERTSVITALDHQVREPFTSHKPKDVCVVTILIFFRVTRRLPKQFSVN